MRGKFICVVLMISSCLFEIKIFAKEKICPSLNYEGLKKIVIEKGGKNLIFVSTWCSDCKKHFQKSDSSDSIIIVCDHDERRIQEIVSRYQVSIPCFQDNGIAKVLKIKILPAKVYFDLKSF